MVWHGTDGLARQVKPKDCSRTAQAATISMFEWALRLGGRWGPFRGRLTPSSYESLPAKSSQYSTLRPTTLG